MLTTAQCIAEVRARLSGHREPVLWVGVDGLTAAGKTTFAEALASDLEYATVVHGDDLALPSGDPWDFDRFRTQVWVPLREGRTGRYQRRHWTTKQAGEWVDVPPGVVIVEGIRTFAAEVSIDWDLRIWVEAPDDVRLERARTRDNGSRWVCWSENWAPKEAAYVAEQDPASRADLTVLGVG